MYSDSDSFGEDFAEEEYMSLEPSHIANYIPLTEPCRDPVDDLRVAIFRFDGNVDAITTLIDEISPQLESTEKQSLVMNGSTPQNNDRVTFYSDDEDEEEDEDLAQLSAGGLVNGGTATDNSKMKSTLRNEILFSNGWTPLIQASHLGLHEIVSLLIDRKFNVNYKSTSSDMTALLAVCSVPNALARQQTRSHVNHDTVVQILVTSGADVSVYTGENQAIHLAAMNNRYSAIEILVQSGADINTRNKIDRTPLMLAAEKGYMRTVNTILQPQFKALPALEDRNGNTAAYLAGISGFNHLSDTLSTISGEAAKDDRLYRAWWLVKQALTEEQGNDEQGGRQSLQSGIDKSSKNLRDYDELASFCYGLELGHLLPVFRNQGMSMTDLKRMSDTELIKIGVDVFQDRKKILDLVQEMHKRPWQDEDSLPKFDYGKPLKAADLINMMGNTARHLEFMDGTVGYLSNHVRNNSSLYVKETGDVPHSVIIRLSDKCEEAMRYARQLHASCVQLRQLSQQLMENAQEDIYPDLVLEETVNEIKKTSYKRSCSIVILGLSACCVVLYLGKRHGNLFQSVSQLFLSSV